MTMSSNCWISAWKWCFSVVLIKSTFSVNGWRGARQWRQRGEKGATCVAGGKTVMIHLILIKAITPRKGQRALGLALLILCGATVLGRAQVISEFLARNNGLIFDEDGDSPDWIEIHNPTAQPVPLLNWALTDSPTNLTKWRFPATNLASGGYLLVYASGKDRVLAGQPLHTNFKL